MISKERLHELLHYDKTSGVFTCVAQLSNVKAGSVAGTFTAKGYIQIRIDKRFYRAHRLAWLYEYGVHPTLQIDHIDGDKSNNAIRNLRDVTNSVNHQNKRKARADNKTGVLGVCKKDNKFRAQIAINGTVAHLGYFKTPGLAHEAYVKAKRIVHLHGTTI